MISNSSEIPGILIFMISDVPVFNLSLHKKPAPPLLILMTG